MPPPFDAQHPPDRGLIDTCVHCGFCLPTCPTYALWGEEMDSPRGRIYLMKAGLEERVGLTPSFVRHFDACLGCMGCVTACPSGVQYAPLIEATRAQIERRYPRGVADRLFRAAIFAIVPFPRRLRLALAPVPLLRVVQPYLQRSGVLSLLPSRLRALIELAPPVTWRNLTAGPPPERIPAVGAKRMTVGVLTGCVQRLAFSRVNDATIRVLAAEGCEVIVPRTQGCCGALPLHSGREEEARRFARQAIASFEQAAVDRIVVNAAGCGSAMKEYDKLLADDAAWQGRAAAFAGRVRDVVELLAELGPSQSPRHPLALRIAYHDACHLAHAQGIRQQPRDLLGAIPGTELLPFAEQDLCCGSAGIYNLVQPDAARDLGARKVGHIAAVEPDVVATANPGCTLQIAASAVRSGRTLAVLHPIELIDASIRGRQVDEVVREGIYFRAAR